MKNLFSAVALAAAFAFPMAAHAVTTVTADQTYDDSASLEAIGGVDTVSFNFTADSDFDVTVFNVNGLSSVGTAFADLSAITFSVVHNAVEISAGPFGTISPLLSGGAQAISTLADFSVLSGDTFSISFFGEVSAIALVGYGFTTAAPVPLPAAGGLLLSTLLAGGFVARRKKKKSA